MLCALTVRRLKPGTFEQFREAWTSIEVPPGWSQTVTARSLDDPDEIVSFGFFDGTLEELRRSQREFDYSGQRAAVDAVVEETRTDGIFEVAVELAHQA